MSAIVEALSLGAAALAKWALSEAGKDAYKALIEAIVRIVSPDDIEKLQQKPDSKRRKWVIAKELEEAGKAEDPQLAKLAETLVVALKEAGASGGATGVSIETVEALNVRLQRITASGTGVSIKESKTRDIVNGDIRAGRIIVGGDIIVGDGMTVGSISGESAVLGETPDRLKSGNTDYGVLLHNTPETMRVDDTEIIEARIAREVVEGFREGLRGKGPIKEEETPIASVMELRLYGDPNVFSIDSLTAESHIIDQQMKGFAEWRWSILPLKSGEHELELSITGKTIAANGVAGTIAFDPVVKKISVRVNPVYTAKKVAKWGVPLILAAAIGALIGEFAKELVGFGGAPPATQ